MTDAARIENSQTEEVFILLIFIFSYHFCDKMPFNGVMETEKRRPAVCFAVPASAQKHWRF